MKKRLFYLFALICSMSLSFSSCSDDDGKNSELPGIIDNEIVGNYKGTMDVFYEMGTDIPVAKDMLQKITIKKISDTSVGLELKNFVITVDNEPMTIGDLAIENCPVTVNGNNYSFSGNANLSLVVGQCAVSVLGSVSGNELNLTIKVDVVGEVQGMKVRVEYTGTKLSGSESSEAKIKSFIFDRNVAAVDSLVLGEPVIDEENKTITFVVADTAKAEYLEELVPTIVLSNDKATVFPESGKKQDFNSSVYYTVTAEDGTTAIYTVSISSKELALDFENWVQDETYGYYTPVGSYASTNGGSAIVYSSLEGIATEHSDVVVPPYCVTYSTEDVKQGQRSACLQTVSLYKAKQDLEKYDKFLGPIMARMAPNITAGSLFVGRFELNPTAALKSTKFGVLCTAKPLKFSGWYKYTPGEVYYDKEYNVKEEVDECDIYAILYEAKDSGGKDITLDGETVNSSDAPIVMRAGIQSGAATDGWKRFELDFEEVNGKTYDSSKEYKIAFICTSSKKGDAYEGAPNSTLMLDDLKITFEK